MFEADVEELLAGIIQSGAIEKCIDQYLEEIKEKVKTVFAQAIMLTVYDYYTPRQYIRNEEILYDRNAIAVRVDKGVLTCVINTSVLNYYTSAKTGLNVSNSVWGWIENGHDDKKGIKRRGQNQYHRYERRKYLEMAQLLLQLEFGVLVEIINF